MVRNEVILVNPVLKNPGRGSRNQSATKRDAGPHNMNHVGSSLGSSGRNPGSNIPPLNNSSGNNQYAQQKPSSGSQHQKENRGRRTPGTENNLKSSDPFADANDPFISDDPFSAGEHLLDAIGGGPGGGSRGGRSGGGRRQHSSKTRHNNSGGNPGTVEELLAYTTIS